MATWPDREQRSTTAARQDRSSSVGLAVALAALAAVGAGIAIQQILERRLSRPEVARLRFYRYLRERGRLES
jgi:F0F1-type ATP synthase membrane subunit c/vacuolar-type H+-ATPase subunit K